MIYIKENVERVANTELEAARLKSLGFKPLGDESFVSEDTATDKMTVKELKEIAKSRGIEGAANLKKDELLEILAEDGEPNDGDGEKSDPSQD